MMLRQMAASNDTPSGIDDMIARSIGRADREMYEIKRRYAGMRG